MPGRHPLNVDSNDAFPSFFIDLSFTFPRQFMLSSTFHLPGSHAPSTGHALLSFIPKFPYFPRIYVSLPPVSLHFQQPGSATHADKVHHNHSAGTCHPEER